MMTLISSVVRTIAAPTRLQVVATTTLLALSTMIIRYRGYWLGFAGTLALILVVAIRFRWLIARISRIRVALVLGVLGGSFTMATLSADEIANTAVDVGSWLDSAFREVASSSGNIAFRLENDWSRVGAIHDSAVTSWKYFGVGFVPAQSRAHARLGFTSETNDSGLVEVIVTSGWFGLSVLSVLLVILCAFLMRWLLSRRNYRYLAALACVFFATITMVSSNMLLWDFGFVPLGMILWSAVVSED